MNANIADAGSIARTRGWTTLVLMVGEASQTTLRRSMGATKGAWAPAN